MKSRAFDELDATLKKAEISMTPLIDMVFILLIFFVVTTTFTKETGITVEKAKASTSQMIQNDLFSIAIGRDGTYWNESQQYSPEQLLPKVLQAFEENSETNVVIIPDKNGQIDPLIVLLDMLRAEEITRFSLGTEREE